MYRPRTYNYHEKKRKKDAPRNFILRHYANAVKALTFTTLAFLAAAETEQGFACAFAAVYAIIRTCK